jgi:hypothetical protein
MPNLWWPDAPDRVHHAQRRQLMASRQDGLIFAFVPLRQAHVLDAAETVIDVVPVHEVGTPSTRRPMMLLAI